MLSDNLKFKDRIHAGHELGEKLLIRAFPEPLILALPRGGVPVAEEVARILGAPLEVVVARKIGAPGNEEFAIGALSEDEVPHFNPTTSYYFDDSSAEIHIKVQEEIEELRRRILLYRSGRELPALEEKTVIVVDDGLATGATAAAAGFFLRGRHPKTLIFAAPVCPQEMSSEVRRAFDEIICLHRPGHFQAVGLWYENFEQVEDEEVLSLLSRHHINIPLPHSENRLKFDNIGR